MRGRAGHLGVYALALAAIPLAGVLACSSGPLVEVEEPASSEPEEPAVVGTWQTCRQEVTYEADGTWYAESHDGECAREGTYEMRGDQLDRRVERGCDAGGEREGIEVRAFSDGIRLYHEEFGGGYSDLFSLDADRRTWWIEGTSERVGADEDAFDSDEDAVHYGETVAVVIGHPGGAGRASACYWSADGDCDGLFSCSGRIEWWRARGDDFTARTGCSGWCPCGASLTGSVLSDGTIEGEYFGAHCESNIRGEFVAVPQND